MTDRGEELGRPAPPVFTHRQQSVLRALTEVESTRYRISLYYLGALCALDNPYNPERISQAAHSLRELLDKLPRIVLGRELPKPYDNPSKPREMAGRIAKERERYSDGWVGEIDRELGITIESVSEFLGNLELPTRRENIRAVLQHMDPLTDRFESRLSARRLRRVSDLQKELEGFAHHGGGDDENEFRNCIYGLEEVVLDVLALTTAENQEEILSILGESV